MLSIEEAKELVGKPYEFYKDGDAWACIAPMYEIIPQTKIFRYKFEEVNGMLSYFEKNAEKIDLTNIKFGDIIIVLLPRGLWHLLIYLDKGDCLHCTDATGMAITKLSTYKPRIKGVFRYGVCSSVDLA